MKKTLAIIPFLLFGLVYAQTKPKAIIKSERKIYAYLMKGEWKRGEMGCYDEYNEYNEKGQLLKQFQIVYDEESAKDSLVFKQLNTYQNGKIVSEEHYFGQKNKSWENRWKYDSLGRQISLVTKYFYASGNEKSTSKGTKTSYPSSNTSVEISGSYYASKIPPEEYKMEPTGKPIIPKPRVYMEIEEEKMLNDFDASGNLIKSTSYLFDNSVGRIRIYKYDNKNRLIYEKATGINPFEATYSYNKNGLLNKEIFTNVAGTETTDYKYTQYDQFGNWTEQVKSERKTNSNTEPDDLLIIGDAKKNAVSTWRIQREITYY